MSENVVELEERKHKTIERVYAPLFDEDLEDAGKVKKMINRLYNLRYGEKITYFYGRCGNIKCGDRIPKTIGDSPGEQKWHLFRVLSHLRDTGKGIFLQKRETNNENGPNNFHYVVYGAPQDG